MVHQVRRGPVISPKSSQMCGVWHMTTTGVGNKAVEMCGFRARPLRRRATLVRWTFDA